MGGAGLMDTFVVNDISNIFNINKRIENPATIVEFSPTP